jgi:hypothetical protein
MGRAMTIDDMVLLREQAWLQGRRAKLRAELKPFLGPPVTKQNIAAIRDIANKFIKEETEAVHLSGDWQFKITTEGDRVHVAFFASGSEPIP